MGVESDRELLDLAAKAAGITGFSGEDCHGAYFCTPANHDIHRSVPTIYRWLADDGDALRLAVTLELGVVCKRRSDPYEKNRSVVTDPYRVNQLRIVEAHKGDPAAATRRAIVRAAAEIGRGM